jgi:hypothetical protein
VAAFHQLWGYRAKTEDSIAKLLQEIKRDELYFTDFKVGGGDVAQSTGSARLRTCGTCRARQ